MIVVDSRMQTKYLNFTNAYTLLLPERAVKGERFPLILCLHDLGGDRWQCMREMDTEDLVERLGIALVLPDGRRSCFLNMAHGPRWSDYLAQELLVRLCHTFPLERQKTGVVGVGAGALGALALARQGIPCALTEPRLGEALSCDGSCWLRAAEWSSVLEGCEAQWNPTHWEAVQGTLAGSKEALDDADRALGLSHWKKLYCKGDAGERWAVTLTELAGRMETFTDL